MQQTKARTQPHSSPLAGFLVSAPLDIFQTLLAELDTEGRYLFLNAVANQLRYPNTHTHYFSFILLYLFAESNQVRASLNFNVIIFMIFDRMVVLSTFGPLFAVSGQFELLLYLKCCHEASLKLPFLLPIFPI